VELYVTLSNSNVLLENYSNEEDGDKLHLGHRDKEA
jgi:hypothetical protein